ncbi:MAG: hypothetical protein M3367_12815 [Acidobacteriota bacterium]|nr:hypothetical protein [Acidobacteriota bacterium]
MFLRLFADKRIRNAECGIKSKDGEKIVGTIEWYVLDALKINRADVPNLLLPKHNIKYI